MGLIFFVVITWLIATVAGAVILIQMGGWLSILAAILQLIFFFLAISIFLIAWMMNYDKRRKEE